ARFLDVVFRIIDSGGSHGTGLPIGNLTSQFLANVYLDTLDTYIRHKLKGLAYIRYMDDVVLFSNSKESLKQVKPAIETFLAERLRLNLKERATLINQRLNGLSFLGARIYPATIRIHRKSLKRSLKTLKQRKWEFNHCRIRQDTYLNSLNSIAAHISWFHTATIRKFIFDKG
ncbi:MAG: RNA-directed DNA polymerase, partial [Candidatus Marinimicrobia bacterium]|nr:RNA-directed DNA polymerase [Candidatus Neomarinimicrobiota bacterium]